MGLTVGGKVIENVTGSVNPVATDALLGQSFLTRFKSWSIDNARQALQLEPQDMQPAQPASTAATFYQARYFLTGYLLRAAVVCEGDGKRTVDAGFGLLGSPELRAISKAYPKTIEQWMGEGSALFNRVVMNEGIGRACAYAITVRSRAEDMTRAK